MINNPTYLNPSSRCQFPNGLRTSTAFLLLGFSLPKQNGVPCPLGRPRSGRGFQGILYRPGFSYYLKIQQHFLKEWYISYIRFEDYLTATYFVFFSPWQYSPVIQQLSLLQSDLWCLFPTSPVSFLSCFKTSS